jgi:hypothetical protein
MEQLLRNPCAARLPEKLIRGRSPKENETTNHMDLRGITFCRACPRCHRRRDAPCLFARYSRRNSCWPDLCSVALPAALSAARGHRRMHPANIGCRQCEHGTDIIPFACWLPFVQRPNGSSRHSPAERRDRYHPVLGWINSSEEDRAFAARRSLSVDPSPSLGKQWVCQDTTGLRTIQSLVTHQD